MTGLLCGIPHVARMLFACCFSTFGDWLLRTDKMSRTNVRKLAGSFSLLVNGLFVIGLAFAGCNAVVAIVFITLATGAQGAVSSGPLANIIDISPNYSGVILGIASFISTAPGIISPYIVGKLTIGNVSIFLHFFLSNSCLFAINLIIFTFSKLCNNGNWCSSLARPC